MVIWIRENVYVTALWDAFILLINQQFNIRRLPIFVCSIYLVHDEVKDKLFEMELSWVCEESGGRHQFVPDALYKEAERYAKAALEEDSSDEDEEM